MAGSARLKGRPRLPVLFFDLRFGWAQRPREATLGNAIADAAGQRLRDLPLSRQRIRAALGT